MATWRNGRKKTRRLAIYWNGRRLADACTLLEDYREDLTPQQVDFIEQSRRSAESGVRQRMRRLRVAVAGFAALALIALVGALFALHAREGRADPIRACDSRTRAS